MLIHTWGTSRPFPVNKTQEVTVKSLSQDHFFSCHLKRQTLGSGHQKNTQQWQKSFRRMAFRLRHPVQSRYSPLKLAATNKLTHKYSLLIVGTVWVWFISPTLRCTGEVLTYLVVSPPSHQAEWEQRNIELFIFWRNKQLMVFHLRIVIL